MYNTAGYDRVSVEMLKSGDGARRGGSKPVVPDLYYVLEVWPCVG